METDYSFAEEIIQKARQKGIDLVEVYLIDSRNLSVEVKDGKVEGHEEAEVFGYGIRIIKDGRLGFSYSTSRDEWESSLRKAMECSEFASLDEDLTLPEPQGYYHRVEVFDPAINSLDGSGLLKHAMELEGSAFKVDQRIKKTRKASISTTVSRKTIVNSLGIDITYDSTSCIAHIMVVAEDAQEAQSAWEFGGGRFLKDISFSEIGRRAAEKALSLLGSKRISSRKSAILMEPSVAVDFLGLFAHSFSAEEVLKGKSLLAGRIGQRVLSPLINITDNALLPGRLGTRPVDAEGVNSRVNQLVIGGVLQGYLHNTYTARRASSRSTGNAVRGSYAELPLVGVSNLYISPSEGTIPLSFRELINADKEMLYVLDVMGMHTANPVTGDFSVGVSGLWIERGEVLFPVKEAMIAGNILDLFNSVIALGDDLRFYGSMGSPHILLRDIDISG